MTGAVQFDSVRVTADPIIGTFASHLNSWGAVKFLANGSVESSNGSHGTWRAFDPASHTYSVTIDATQLSLRYIAGRGLVETDNPTFLAFQELK